MSQSCCRVVHFSDVRNRIGFSKWRSKRKVWVGRCSFDAQGCLLYSSEKCIYICTYMYVVCVCVRLHLCACLLRTLARVVHSVPPKFSDGSLATALGSSFAASGRTARASLTWWVTGQVLLIWMEKVGSWSAPADSVSQCTSSWQQELVGAHLVRPLVVGNS